MRDHPFRDGTQLLYRRLRRGETVSGNRYGEQGSLVVARSDGTGERVLGPEGALPWASWSPDGREIATLSVKGIAFVEVATGRVRRTLPRHGFFQQLTWSPDGRYIVFTGNPQEDGDPEHSGAPMGLMRIQDAPLIGGESAELRALHPSARRGLVLTLPTGWEPCWTASENPARSTTTPP